MSAAGRNLPENERRADDFYATPPWCVESLLVGCPRFYTGFAEDAVQCFCPPDGLVCDPFVGSGTSAYAAVKHARRFVGGDLHVRPSDGKPWAHIALDRAKGITS